MTNTIGCEFELKRFNAEKLARMQRYLEDRRSELRKSDKMAIDDLDSLNYIANIPVLEFLLVKALKDVQRQWVPERVRETIVQGR